LKYCSWILAPTKEQRLLEVLRYNIEKKFPKKAKKTVKYAISKKLKFIFIKCKFFKDGAPIILPSFNKLSAKIGIKM
jgi:hypothetical protein